MAKDGQTSELVFQADVSQFTQAISQMKSDMRLIDSEFEASSSSLDDWSSSSEGLESKIKQLNGTLKSQESILSSMKSRQEEYTTALDKNKKKLSELKNQYDAVVAKEGESSESAKKLAKQMSQVQLAITKNEKAYKNEAIAINKQQATINKTTKELKGYEKSLKTVGKETDDVSKKTKEANNSAGKFGSGLAKLSGGVMKGLAKSIAGVALSVAGLTTAFFASAESTREYRTEMAKLKTINDEVDASFEETKKAYQDLVAVTNDEGAATEAINNLLTAGFKGDELDQVNQYIQGAAIQWKDTLKAEGLSDSIQEWIGSGGESLTGNIAEMLERMGYNLETVSAETAGYTDEQRRAYIMNLMAKEGLGEISQAYKEENKDMYEASLAAQNLTDKMAEIGKIAEPLTTIFKNQLAKALEYITPWLNRVGNALELLFSDNKLTGIQRLGEIFTDLKDKVNEALLGLLGEVTAIIPELLPKVAEMLGQVLQKTVEFAPLLLDAILSLIGSLVEALPEVITSLLDQLPVILDSVISALNEMIPALLEAAIQLLSSLISAIPVVIEKLVEVLPQLLSAITGFIQQNLPLILSAFMELLMQLVYALPVVLQSLADALPTIIGAVVDFITTNLPLILEMAIKLFSQIVAAIPVLIVNLQKQLPTIISKIVSTLLANAPKIFQMGVDLFLEIVKAIPVMIIELAKNLPEITETILDAFKDAPTMLFDVGKDIVEGLWDGIVSMGDWLWKKVTGFFGDIEGWAKDVLGIHSPSKVFAEIGKYTAEGYEVGIDKEMKNVKKSIQDNFSADDLNINANVKTKSSTSLSSGNNASGKNVVLNYTVNSPKQLSRRETYLQAKKATTILGGAI